MKLALYTRVSTEDQHQENQVLVLRDWAAAQGHEVVREYQDTISGVKRREQLDELMRAATRREFDMVAMWSLDRLTREGTFQSLYYLNTLTSSGIRVFSYQQPMLNPGAPFYDVVVAVYAEVARLERLQISERTKAGMARVKRQGGHVGRPKGSRDGYKRLRRRRYDLARTGPPLTNGLELPKQPRGKR